MTFRAKKKFVFEVDDDVITTAESVSPDSIIKDFVDNKGIGAVNDIKADYYVTNLGEKEEYLKTHIDKVIANLKQITINNLKQLTENSTKFFHFVQSIENPSIENPSTENNIKFQYHGGVRQEMFSVHNYYRRTIISTSYDDFFKASVVNNIWGVYSFIHELFMQSYAHADSDKNGIFIPEIKEWGVIYSEKNSEYYCYVFMTKMPKDFTSLYDFILQNKKEIGKNIQVGDIDKKFLRIRITSIESEKHKKLERLFGQNKKFEGIITLLLKAMNYFKQKQLKHNDGILSNIYVDSNLEKVAIIDFGRACLTGHQLFPTSFNSVPIPSNTYDSVRDIIVN
jgi:hypothetical protein